MMKIGFFIPSYLPNIGGAEIALHNYLINLNQKKKISVFLLISFESWIRLKFNKIKLPYDVKIIYFPFLFRLNKYFPMLASYILEFFLKKIHKKLNVNIWHIIMMYPTATICSDFFIRNKIPWIVRAIGVDIQIHKKLNYGYRINNKINSLVIKKATKANAYIASSDDVYNEYLNLNINHKNIYKISNSVHTKIFNNHIKDISFKKKYKILEGEKIFLTVGRYHVKKDFITLLKAIKIFADKIYDPKSKFIFYGTNLITLKQLSIKLNISKLCIFIEENNTINDYNNYFPNIKLRNTYLNSDFFICPSIIETFGIVIVEAMAANLPIIASNAKGCRNILDNGKYGLQFSVGNENELSKCIERFYLNDDTVKKYKELSSLRAKKYDLDSNLENILSLYKKIISEKK